MKDKLFPYLTGVLCVGVAVLAAYTFTHQYRLPKSVAHLSDVSALVSRSTHGVSAASICQSSIAQAIENQGGGTPIFGTPTVRKGEVYLHVHSAIYTGWAACKVVRSFWQALSNGPSTGPPNKKPSS